MKEDKAVEERGPPAYQTEKTCKNMGDSILDTKQASGYINDEYLRRINNFCQQISSNSESRTEIRKFFSQHPRAREILRRQVFRSDNYAILRMHLIINMKVDGKVLLHSLKGHNVSEKNCFMIFELYFFRLFDDIEAAKDKFAVLDDCYELFKRAESHAKLKIVEKDWERYEQRKYYEAFIKDRRLDVARMCRKMEKSPEILCRTKRSVDFLIVIDLDSFCHECEQLKRDNLEYLGPGSSQKRNLFDHSYIDSIIHKNNDELEIVLDFMKDNKYKYVLIHRKATDQYSYLHDFEAIRNENITWYTKFEHKPLLEKYGMKRCFILKNNTTYTRVDNDCYYISFDRLYNILVSFPLPDNQNVLKKDKKHEQ
ncbi:hypothetical protein THOM_0559 [Trachipleistophora hominis]|uniref:Uncharacterized protein n=1 Tax=Trachipleistophora hominis TaxID=72359 RepID=L7JYQ4_TRAHO|nr:hypothetical protein THOM_0559 [Trachipleistophora hominis]